jgi:diguanylate cyclase (GGDEF)-like protein
MGSFVIMDINQQRERIFALIFSFISLFLFFLNRYANINFYMHELGEIPTKIISFYTIISTMSILILYFYLHAYFLAQKRKELEYLANTDSLTDISNRRNFYNLSALEFELAHKYDHTFTLLLLDIDHFKKINDTYGHDCGDEVLKHLTKTIKDNVREQDIFARHGGEEFTLLLRHSDSTSGYTIAEKLRRLVESLEIQTHEHIINITVSIGLVQFSKDIKEFDGLVNLADKALYEAKENGRNQTIVWVNE